MKKVLSFVLILALVLGSFSFAFGLSDVTEATANSEAITVVNDLEIVNGFPDGTFKAEQAVTRAEFAAMITRALGVPESALAGFSATSFKDTNGYGWAVKYLAFCESKGILIGDGMGNVMPGRTINVNEAMTMVLRAVGYTENSAILVGTWPAKYVTVAQNLGLYDDVASMLTVDRGNAAQIIYNALTVQKVQVDADGATTGLTTGVSPNEVPVTMLTSGLKASQDNKGKAYVLASTDADTAVINAQKYVGAFVKTYSNNDGDIIAVEEISTFLTGKYIAADKVFKANGVEFNLASPNAINYDWNNNGTAANNVSPMAVFNGQTSGVSVSMDNNNTTYTIAVDWSGKTIKEVYSIATWVQETSFEFEADMLEDDNLNAYDFMLDDNDAIDNSTFTLLGVKSLADISVDDVVTVYLDTPVTGKIVKVEVGTEQVTGTITKVSGPDYTIDGKVYNKSASPAPTLALGETGTASLDYNGDIAFWNLDDASVGNYAMFITTDRAVSFGTTTVKVKLFDKTGTEITPTCKDAVTGSAATIYNKVVVDKITDGAIVEFDLDKDGKVKTLTSAAVATQLTGKTSKDGSLIGTTVVYPGVVVFLLNSDGDFEIGSVADFDTTINFNAVDHTAVVDGGKIKAIAALKSDIMDAGGDSYGVINATSVALDADEDSYLALEGFMDGVAFDKLTDEATPATGWTTTTTAGLTMFTVNADGVITDFTSLAGITSSDFVSEVAVGLANTVASISGNQIKMSSTGAVYLADASAVVYLWDATDGEWTLSRLSALKGKNVKMYTTDTDDFIGFNIFLAW